MDDIKVNVEDYTFVQTSIINNIKIKIMNIDLFKSITLCVSLLNNNKNVENKIIKITDAEYTNWGNDDNYIVNLVLTKLGLSKKS
jgi:hypothetical protein